MQTHQLFTHLTPSDNTNNDLLFDTRFAPSSLLDIRALPKYPMSSYGGDLKWIRLIDAFIWKGKVQMQAWQ